MNTDCDHQWEWCGDGGFWTCVKCGKPTTDPDSERGIKVPIHVPFYPARN